ncbi:MAG: segregation/condensation protein A, partial [candidate division Zixibacteria bacterium]|nr:segregation/condensation protein A [candidate division Zixibacteria bacterium]NIR67824.1 segregation/condensation protein A [candidate division Zixibacteria bacterium]NIS15524.1 segregation/condensation protein A [candidate division Zixibacteria bacterium]NIS49049.1 segregation/condensation protein A [candidate division Zixibacteria bacterium]NIT52043.1 segregation/condensation protein A [candidate division Zixibacteria bacterium]
EATIFDLMRAFKEALENLENDIYHTVRIEDVSIEERVEIIERMLSERGQASFQELYSDSPYRLVVIVTFLAILELIKLNRLVLRQAIPFGPIRIYLNKNE